jgi:hypothetical protein
MPNLKVVIQYDDVKLNSTAKIQNAILNIDNIISATTDPTTLISGDIGNELTVSSDNKLSLETDKLQTSFEYATSVSTFWSI